MTVALRASKRTRMVVTAAGNVVFQEMAGSAEVPPLTRFCHAKTIMSIDTGSQQKLIGRTVWVMAVSTHNDLVLGTCAKAIRSVRILCKAIIARRRPRFPVLPMPVRGDAATPIDCQQIS
jgi:hypothetical protein